MNDELFDNLKKIADRIDGHSDKLNSWNEDEVKSYLIEPLLNSLLWDTTDPNFVRHQYQIKVGSEIKHADYALMSGDSPICIIEAKPSTLDEASAKQALSYAKILNVPWAITTNGVRVCLYGTEYYSYENANNALIFDVTISLDSVIKIFDTLKYLSNGLLDSKEVYTVFKSYNERRSLYVFLENKKDFLIKEIISKWIEENWKKGPVNIEFLTETISELFGKVEIIEKNYENLQPIFYSTSKLVDTAASEWKHRPDIGKGFYEYKNDSNKRIDVALSGPNVEEQLKKMGLKTSTTRAFGGFYYNLRKEAQLIRR